MTARARLRYADRCVPDHVRAFLPLARDVGLDLVGQAGRGGRVPVLDVVGPDTRTRRPQVRARLGRSRLVYDGSGTPGLADLVRDGPLAAHLPAMLRAEVVTCTTLGEALELGSLGVPHHRLHLVPTVLDDPSPSAQDRARRLVHEAGRPAHRLVVLAERAARVLRTAAGPPPDAVSWHTIDRVSLDDGPAAPVLRALLVAGARLVTTADDRRGDPWLALAAGRRPLLVGRAGSDPADDDLDRLDAADRVPASWADVDAEIVEPGPPDPRLLRLARGRHGLPAVAPRWVHAMASAIGS